MRARASFVLVGLFVLVLGVGLIAAVLWLSTGGAPRDYDFYHVYMTESVSGLTVDAPVRYKGVSRGRVREIGLDPENPERVRLLLVVLEGTPISADTVATLELQGLTGLASINLSGGGKASPALEARPGQPYPVIPSKPSLLVRLDDTISELLGNLIQTSARINTLLTPDNTATLNNTLANAERISASLVQRLDDLRALLEESEGILHNARLASSHLPRLVERFGESAASLQEMANALAAAGGNLQDTGAHLQSVVAASGEDLARFTGVALPEAANLVTELRRAAENLRRVSEALERDPSALVFGAAPPPPGPGEEGVQ